MISLTLFFISGVDIVGHLSGMIDTGTVSGSMFGRNLEPSY